MKRFLNSVLCMCIAVFCTHAQKKNVTSVLEVMDITTGQRSVVKEFPFLMSSRLAPRRRQASPAATAFS